MKNKYLVWGWGAPRMVSDRLSDFRNVSIGMAFCLTTGMACGQDANAVRDNENAGLDDSVSTQSPPPEDAAENNKVTELDEFTVKARRLSAADRDRAKLEKVAGAVAVVDQKQIERGRATNLEDQLVLQPGVYAQSTSGNGANKVSIRGSGLNTFYGGYSLGIKYLYDGLPITGPGGTHEDLLTANAIDHTEVLYGANAFAYTALSLGGAINFVTHNGYTAPGHYARFEFGSFGYSKQQLSTGGVIGDSDYYVSVLHNKRDGFQDFTDNSGRDFIGNVGHIFSPKLETRFIVRYREENLLNGSTLSKSQISDDPTQTNVLSGRKKNGTTLVISKTSYTFDDDSRLEIGLDYNNYPLLNGWRYSATPQWWDSTDTTATVRYLRSGDKLFGRPSDTTFSFSYTRLDGDVRAYNRNNWSLRQYTDYTGSSDMVFAAGNELQLDDKLWLSTGVSLIDIDRDVRIKYTSLKNTSAFPDRQHYKDTEIAPRVGFRYQVAPTAQLFANVSRSIDPPVTWYFGSTSVPYIRPMTAQKATTAEAGIRGKTGIFDGSLTLYRSWVDKELLSVVVIPATTLTPALIANSNATPTIHQGIEAGLNARLWGEVDSDNVILRQAYTLNDFYYEHDPVFGNNRLPSLPKHVYQAELQYQSSNGFYAGLNLRAASSYYVDYANTLKAPAYAILGAKLGYEAPSKRWSVFLDARNLTDRNYVTASNTAYDLKGKDNANFYPGDGFGVTAGASFHF